MDKRTVYRCSRRVAIYCGNPICPDRDRQYWNCTEAVLVDSDELAKVEQVIAKKDEALRRVSELSVDQCKATCAEPCDSATCDLAQIRRWVEHALSLTPDSVAKEVEDKRQYLSPELLGTLANLTDYLEGMLRAVQEVRLANEGALPTIERVAGILKPTEAETQQVEDARVGRVVEEWQQQKETEWRAKQKCSGLNHYVDAYIDCLDELDEVIAKAREGEGK